MKFATLVFAVVLGAGLHGWRALPKQVADNEPVSQAVASPDETQAATEIRVTGRVQPKTRVSISALVSLPVVELPFKEGDRVCKARPQDDPPVTGSVLAKLDDCVLRAALRVAEAKRDAQAAEIEAAKARLAAMESQVASSRVCLDEAERNWRRYEQLKDTTSVSQAEIDGARCKSDRCKAELDTVLRSYAATGASLKVAEKGLRAAEDETVRARLSLGTTTIASPIDGYVTRVNVTVGEVVTGAITTPGTVLMEVADLDHMVLIARLDEDLVGKVKVGQAAAVRLSGVDADINGTVQHVALASTDETDGSHYFKAEIALDTGGRLIPAGLAATARIECSGQRTAASPSHGFLSIAERTSPRGPLP
jgi:multidrug resistance efflux pump